MKDDRRLISKKIVTVMSFVFIIISAGVALSAEKESDKKTNPSELRETYIGDAVADAMKAAMKTDIAVINGSSLGYCGLPGSINKDNVSEIVPFDSDMVVAMSLNGASLQDALEKSVAALPRRSSSFLQVSGLVFKSDTSKPQGKRIISIEVNGKPIDMKKEYTLATTEFLSRGGGGLSPLRKGEILEQKKETLGSIVLEHLRLKPGDKQAPDNRIIIVSSD